jgi:hypothetical protein
LNLGLRARTDRAALLNQSIYATRPTVIRPILSP